MRSFMERKDDGPENLAEVLSRLFLARGWGRVTQRQRLETIWLEVIGEKSEETRLGGMKRGVLEIEVRGAVLLQELAQFQKKKLLIALREKLPELTITDIKFRSGSW